MIREIITYPNEILYKKSKKVENFDDDLHKILDDMYDTMVDAGGVGLAGIQIGVLLNILLIDMYDDLDKPRDKNNLIEIINPKIISKADEQFQEEGCLSVPGFQAKIKRYQYVEIEYQDRFGEHLNLKADDYLSVAIQHEMDHLQGELFVNKLSIIDRKKFKKALKK